MKKYGVVYSPKSARKHRRAGHVVVKRTGSGWAWVTRADTIAARIIAGMLAAGVTPNSPSIAIVDYEPSQRIGRALRPQAGKSPSLMIVDELHSVPHLIAGLLDAARMRELEDMPLSTPVIHVPKVGEVQEFIIGAAYRPKRGNQHSKAITITGFTRKAGETRIEWSQGTAVGSDTAAAFAERVGRRLA